MTEHGIEAQLAKARAQGVEVGIDRDRRTMHVKLPRCMEADVYADVIRTDNRDDPVEAARQIWHEVAPILRECGWPEEKIITEYHIPDEVLSGGADRRATVRWALGRLAWIEREPWQFWRGEPALIAALRAGEIDEDGFAERLRSLCARTLAIVGTEDGPVPVDETRTRFVPHGEGDTLMVIVDHRPTWRRYRMPSSRQYLDDTVDVLRRRASFDLQLLARGDEPLGEDAFTPPEERGG